MTEVSIGTTKPGNRSNWISRRKTSLTQTAYPSPVQAYLLPCMTCAFPQPLQAPKMILQACQQLLCWAVSILCSPTPWIEREL